MNPGGRWLLAGAALSATASIIHLACIVLGAKWFRFFGAPEPLVAAYEQGDMQLVWMTIGIAIILAIWAAFAASGAGLLPRLPLLRTGLVAISAIYLARGAILLPALVRAPYPGSTFDIWSSAIVLGFGLVYAYGTWAAWSSLRETRQAH
ncbi:hypothetical protein GRI34_11940 [Erythrobacter aquimaris]|uniref:Uncharacterized protein n=1 Tax=Qipengyuania aquimaris TaxID=255984 RepID=A0A6I4TQ87_9SPHN|nr:hypothetical protein [Qipengyuania aquimaris]MXO97127.1 hypothetical protein [Qipengyuania aquimaris]